MKTPYPEIRARLDARLLEVLPGLCAGLSAGFGTEQSQDLDQNQNQNQDQSQDQSRDQDLDLPLTDADVAWPNVSFIPDAGRVYLKPWCLFADTKPVSLGTDGFERLSGVYQISVFDVAGTGLYRAEHIARALADAFRGGTVLGLTGTDGSVSVQNGCEIRISAATAGTARLDDGRLHIPVSVVWTCYVQK